MDIGAPAEGEQPEAEPEESLEPEACFTEGKRHNAYELVRLLSSIRLFSLSPLSSSIANNGSFFCLFFTFSISKQR